jgi:SLBB domain
MWRTTLLGWLYRHDWQLALLLAIAILATAGFVLWPRPAPLAVAPSVISADDVEAAQERTVIVYISGAVRNPGLYTLLATLRVSDAIVAAGGLTEVADPGCLPNLAAHLKDAKQIAVPSAGHCARAKKTRLASTSPHASSCCRCRGWMRRLPTRSSPTGETTEPLRR